MRRSCPSSGFTRLELVVVIVVIGLLACVLLPGLLDSRH
jgi:prepilin-type N-terminal cleavage/methylation domain-containing protein